MSLRVISTPISGSSVAKLAIENEDSPWYVRRPASADEWKRRAGLIRNELLTPDWLEGIAPAINATGLAAERLERAAKSGIAITTGQQPGLFGGPLYTWWKALSARSLADRIESMTGIATVPIFWAATDDSDFAEASYTVIATNDGAERLEMRSDAPDGTPMAEVPLGDVTDLIAKLEGAAGSAANRGIHEIVKNAYTSRATVGSAYVTMLREVLEPLGIPVLDASHPSVRKAAFPLLRKTLEHSAQIEEALTVRSSDLKRAGHSPQVKLVKGRTLVFGDYSGRRDRVRMRDVEETLQSATPGSLGPNVLLRPIVERSIIPTVAYVGGGAEVAYFAQTTAVAEALGVQAPLIVPRWSGMIVEPRIEKILERHSLSVDDFRDPHAVETRIAKNSLPASLRHSLNTLKESFEDSVQGIKQADGADMVPSSVIDGLTRALTHRVERLERRYAASIKRRGNESLRDVAAARGSLFPFGTPQERALNIVPLLARHGDELIGAVDEQTRRHAERLT
jgi:bacillithiol biosynthesis cysteine-adding enzyme BshC